MNGMGGACGAYGGGERCARVLVEKPEGKRPLGDPDIDGRIILRWIFGKWEGGDWMELAQDRDRWRALVNTVMNFRVP